MGFGVVLVGFIVMVAWSRPFHYYIHVFELSYYSQKHPIIIIIVVVVI